MLPNERERGLTARIIDGNSPPRASADSTTFPMKVDSYFGCVYISYFRLAAAESTPARSTPVMALCGDRVLQRRRQKLRCFDARRSTTTTSRPKIDNHDENPVHPTIVHSDCRWSVSTCGIGLVYRPTLRAFAIASHRCERFAIFLDQFLLYVKLQTYKLLESLEECCF